jgi:hypothetical protein
MVPMPSRSTPVVCLLALTVFTTGCHGGAKHAASTTTSRPASTTTSSATSTTSVSTTAPTSTSTTSPGPCGPASGPDTSFSVGAPSNTLLLKTLTVAPTARCTDKVVFTFASPATVPGVHVSQVSPPFTSAGDGRRVTIAGERFYAVRFEPASTFDLGSGKPTYAGPTSIVPVGTSHVRQVVETDAFEGVVTWVIGVGTGDQFLAVASASPPSLTLTF